MNAIVTGASRGIGRAIAEKFASMGIHLLLASRKQEDLDNLRHLLIEQYPDSRVSVISCDLSEKQDCISLGKKALEIFERIDILVNNAGTYVPGSICDEPDGALESMLALNLFGAYHLTRVIAPAMKKQDIRQGVRGHILNISSIAALQAYPGGGAYSISKYALQGFSKNLREELKQDLIKVSTINPGATYTDSWEGSGVEQQRIMRPQDIADLVAMLISLSPQTLVEDLVIRPQLGDL